MSAMKLSLYHYYNCPFCALVRRAMDQLGIRIEMRDVLESPDVRRELVMMAHHAVDGLPVRDHDLRRVPGERQVAELVQLEAHDLVTTAGRSPHHRQRAVAQHHDVPEEHRRPAVPAP